MPSRVEMVHKTNTSSFHKFFQLLESYQLHSALPDEAIVLMEVLPKRYVVLDGVHRLCAHYVRTCLEEPSASGDEVTFQFTAKTLWPSLYASKDISSLFTHVFD